MTNVPKKFKDVICVDTGLSDVHNVVCFSTKVHEKKRVPHFIKYRTYRKFEAAKFVTDLSLSPFHVDAAIGLPIYNFLLVSNSNYMSNSHRLGVIATGKMFSYLLSLGPNFDPPTPTFTPRRFFFQNRITSSLGPRDATH